jgi:antitoxin component of RelBE/YafQ-DinJ toxin-antitoxin module
MFAKVFGQIFDSSIAEDYNCRRMFMDLLVLADPDGVVDMTLEAIARRTNVPIEEVTRYIKDLCQPDPTSRSRMEEGKRLVLIARNRAWGWQIVNYEHYRKIKDEEARRAYFRDAKRKQRKVYKSQRHSVDKNGQILTPSSASSSKSACTQKEAEDFCESIGLPRSDGTAMFLHWEEKGWAKVKDWKLTIRKWQSFGYMPSQKAKGGAVPKKPMSSFEIQKRIEAINDEINKIFKSAPIFEGEHVPTLEQRAEIDKLKVRKAELKKQMTI